ncbi:MAG TPA: heterodisulfide reductase-related iron-sulfur binding cluster, partial [Pirellulales bacterium]
MTSPPVLPLASPVGEKPAGAPNPAAGIDYQLFLDCVHCGLCTSACPTFLELGNENDSPRGRIYLMRAVADERIELNDQVKRHLDLCLDCRACETACPSGVQYGKLIEPFRVAMEEQTVGPKKTDDWFHQLILFRLFPYPNRMAWALAPARFAQRMGLMKAAESFGLLEWLPGPLKRLTAMLPPYEPPTPPLPEFLPAIGPRRARVALFSGCVSEALYRRTNWATARVLQANGCDVVVPRSQGCCGAIHFHAGVSEPARIFADQNAKAFHPADVDAIIVNVAGCGAMLKDYPHHWHDENSVARTEFASKVRDVCEFLDQLGAIAPRGAINAVCAYHDACHLRHAQQVADAPRKLLAKIPGLTLVPLAESEICCGAAGTYNLTEPEMSARLATRKVNNIEATGAQILATGNVGCILQIQKEI